MLPADGNERLVVGGAVVLIPALVVLLMASAAGLAAMGLAIGWASLIVGGVALVIGLALLVIGIRRLMTGHFVPTKTTTRHQRDAAVAKRVLSSGDPRIAVGLLDHDARAPHLVERTLAVTRLALHGANGLA